MLMECKNQELRMMISLDSMSSFINGGVSETLDSVIDKFVIVNVTDDIEV